MSNEHKKILLTALILVITALILVITALILKNTALILVITALILVITVMFQHHKCFVEKLLPISNSVDDSDCTMVNHVSTYSGCHRTSDSDPNSKFDIQSMFLDIMDTFWITIVTYRPI